jgi:hypothetical protein
MTTPQIADDKTSAPAVSETTEPSGARPIPTEQSGTETDCEAQLRLAEQIAASPEAGVAPDEPFVLVRMSETDLQAINLIKAIVTARMKDEPYWGAVVLDVLTSYCDRAKQLKDWWIYARFLAAFGGLERGVEQTIVSTWKASDTLDELCKAWQALATFEGWNWLKRLRFRKVQRTAYLDLLALLGTLSANQERWNDWHAWLKYRSGLGH